MMRWNRSWKDPSEEMPVHALPVSNGEFIPPPPTEEQRMIMQLQNEVGERVRRRLAMSRRDFVRSAAALSIGLWATNMVTTGASARHRNLNPDDDCFLADPNVQLANLPGEFIFDVQTHHVDEDGLWRATNPGFASFFAAVWPQARCGDDPWSCLGRYHYIKEIYMDSATTMGVLSAVPSSPERNPLPTAEAGETVALVNDLAGEQIRAVMHAFVMPNRGSYGGTLRPGLFLQQELDDMTAAVETYPHLRAWKCYTPWGDIPNASGWFHDDQFGRAMIEHAIAIGVPVIATHKGFALPSFDQRSATCRDIGIVARDYYNADNDAQSLKIVVYHSGYNNEAQREYPGDGQASSSVAGVDGLIKSLRENGWSARQNPSIGGSRGERGVTGWTVPPTDGNPAHHANTPNVYAEIGSTWRSVMTRQVDAAHLLGKLIYFVGPRRVVWGTDSLWYGSPQPEIARLREFPRANETQAWDILRNTYRLPHGLDGDVDDPSINAKTGDGYPDGVARPERSIRNGIFGRNAAEPYRVNPDAALDLTSYAITCDELATVKQGYVQNAGTGTEVRPMASNMVYGPRTRRELFASMWPNAPWSP